MRIIKYFLSKIKFNITFFIVSLLFKKSSRYVLVTALESEINRLYKSRIESKILDEKNVKDDINKLITIKYIFLGNLYNK